MKNIVHDLARLHDRIAATARRYGRDPAAVDVLAVSKRQPVSAVRAAVAAGQKAFGENYLQEALDKIQALGSEPDLTWHFIGPVQSNKTRLVAGHFHWVHSLEREKIAYRLSEQRPAHLPPLNACIQVNIGGEASKAGVDPRELPELAAAVAALPGIRLRGLMALPAPASGFEQQRLPFRQLRAVFDDLNSAGFRLDTLSMGTSADFEAAIAEGATLLRIGTELFGPRPA